MERVKQIQQQLSDTALLKDLTSTFEAIAAQNLSATRNKVLSAREFLDDAQKVYAQAREVFVARHKLAQKQLEYHEQLTVRPGNGRHLSVIIAPNTKLYGALPDQLLNTAVEQIRKEPRDVLVLGKVGVDFFDRLRPPIPFTTVPIGDEDFSMQQVHDIVAFLSQYQKVTAYYNHFRTVLTADVLESDLTLAPHEEVEERKAQNAKLKTEESGVGGRGPGDSNPSHSPNLSNPAKPNFIGKIMAQAHEPEVVAEPSLEEVLNFFETVILKTLLRQKVHESLLSRYAARMVAMDIATENAKKEQTRLTRSLRRSKRQVANGKMLSNYSGMILWKQS